MDIRRPNPHFSLNPQRSQSDGAAVVDSPAVSAAQPTHDQQQPVHGADPAPAAASDNPDTATVEQFNFEPAPPVAPKPASVYQNPSLAQPVEEAQPAEVQQVKADHATEALKPAKKVKNGRHVPLKYVTAGAITLTLALVISLVVQQMAISELKFEREVLSEQVRVTNPIRAGSAE